MDLIAKICVSVVCYNAAGKILIVEENRNGKVTYNLPTGAVNKSETIVMAASRELFEETGVCAMDLDYLGTTVLKGRAEDTVAYLTYVYAVSAYTCEFQKKIWHSSAMEKVVIADEDVVSAQWMTIPDIIKIKDMWRNDLVMDKVDMYLHNKKIGHFKNVDLYKEAYF